MTVELLPRPAPAGTTPLLIASGDLSLPMVGNWSAHLVMAEAQLAQVPTGKVTLRWLGQDLPGFVERVGENASTVSLLVVGGDGGLGKVVKAQAYNATAATVLRRLLAEAGEPAAAPDSAPAALGKMLDRWPQLAEEAAAVLDELARTTRHVWRVQPTAGRVWLGLHDWLPAPTDGLIEEQLDPVWELVQLALTKYGPEPGQTFGGRRIGHVVYSVTPERAGLKLWLLPDAAAQDLEADPLRAGLAALILEVLRSDPRAALPWAATYTGRVVTQRSDGTIDVTPDHRALPPVNRCRVGVPVPGAKLTIQAGDLVRIAFDAMDVLRPRAELYEMGSGDKPVARVDDSVACGTVTATAPPGGGPVQFIYTPQGGAPMAPSTTLTITGKITSGSPRISLGAS